MPMLRASARSQSRDGNGKSKSTHGFCDSPEQPLRSCHAAQVTRSRGAKPHAYRANLQPRCGANNKPPVLFSRAGLLFDGEMRASARFADPYHGQHTCQDGLELRHCRPVHAGAFAVNGTHVAVQHSATWPRNTAASRTVTQAP